MKKSEKKVGDYIIANPFSDIPIEPENMDLLVNRKKEIDRIDDIIASASKGFTQHIAILGEDGMGKTSLINYVQSQCSVKSGIFFSRINVNNEATEEYLIKRMMQDLLNQVHIGLGSFLLNLIGLGKKEQVASLGKRLEGTEISDVVQSEIKDPLLRIVSISGRIEEKKGRPEDIFEALQLMKQVLNLIKKKVSAVVILFDEAGNVAMEQSISLLQRMRLIFQERPFMLCMGGSPTLFSEFSRIEKTFVNLFPEQNRFYLERLNLLHTNQLIEKRLSQVRKFGKGIIPFQDDSVRMILSESNGNPRYIVRIANFSIYLARDKSYIDRASVVKAADQILIEMGKDRFDRLNKNYQAILLAIGKNPNSTFEIIRKLLGGIPKATISPKINALEKMGYINIERIGREKRCSLRSHMQRYYCLMLE